MLCINQESIWAEFFSSCENSVNVDHQQSQPKSVSEKVIEKVFLPPPSASYLNLLGEMGVPVETVFEKLSYGRQQISRNETVTKSAVASSSSSSSSSSLFSMKTSKLFSGSVRLKFHRNDLIPFFNTLFSTILQKPHLPMKIKSLATMTDSNELICETDDMNIGITVGSSLLGSQIFMTVACRASLNFVANMDSMIIPISPVAKSTILKFLRFLRISANYSGVSPMLNKRQDIINSHFSSLSSSCSTSIAAAINHVPNEFFFTSCDSGNLDLFVELMYEIIVKTQEERNIRNLHERELSHSVEKGTSSQAKLSSYLSKTIFERFRLQINICSCLIPYIVSHVSHGLALSSLSSSSLSFPSPISPNKRCNKHNTANVPLDLELITDRFLHKCLCILSFSYDSIEINAKNEVKLVDIDSAGAALLNQLKFIIRSNDTQSLISVWRQMMTKDYSDVVMKANVSPVLNSVIISNQIYPNEYHETNRDKLLLLTVFIAVIDIRYHLKYNNRVKNEGKNERKKNKLEHENIDPSAHIAFPDTISETVSETVKISVQIESANFVDEFFALCCEVVMGGDCGEIVIVLTSVISLFNRAEKRSLAFHSNNNDGCNYNNHCDVNDINDDGKRKRHRYEYACRANVIFDSTQPEGDELQLHDKDMFEATDGTNLIVTNSHCTGTKFEGGLELGPNSKEDRKNILTDSKMWTLDSDSSSSSSTVPALNLSFHDFNNVEGKRSEMMVDSHLKLPSDSEFENHSPPLLLDYLRRNILETARPVGMFFSIMETRSTLSQSSTNDKKSFDRDIAIMIASVHNRLLSILHPFT